MKKTLRCYQKSSTALLFLTLAYHEWQNEIMHLLEIVVFESQYWQFLFLRKNNEKKVKFSTDLPIYPVKIKNLDLQHHSKWLAAENLSWNGYVYAQK